VRCSCSLSRAGRAGLDTSLIAPASLLCRPCVRVLARSRSEHCSEISDSEVLNAAYVLPPKHPHESRILPGAEEESTLLPEDKVRRVPRLNRGMSIAEMGRGPQQMSQMMPQRQHGGNSFGCVLSRALRPLSCRA